MAAFNPPTVLFSCPDDDQALVDARGYIKRHGLTAEDVKIIKRDGSVVVEAKRVVEIDA